MNIQIDGTNTLNKGAELMLYAVVEQIEKKYPGATVYYNSNYNDDIELAISSSVNLRKRIALKFSRVPLAILTKVRLPKTFFTPFYPLKNLDIVLDAGGFQFSDQWNYSQKKLNRWENYYNELKKAGTKIVFLPQAFGPFDTPAGKRSVNMINNFADLIIAREKTSYLYLINAGVDKERVQLFPDFTSLVKGSFSKKIESAQGKVCIIPNKKMVTHTRNSSTQYLDFLEKLIIEINTLGKEVFLLNHEGSGDLEICRKINERFGDKYEILTRLNAKEVKGAIGASYMVVSSRYHGVASALNQGVPCLSTSWNHKYEMLFQEYDQKNKILDLNSDWHVNLKKLQQTIATHDEIQHALKARKEVLESESMRMWEYVWNSLETKWEGKKKQ